MYKVSPRWWSKGIRKRTGTKKPAALLHRLHTAVTVHVHKKGNHERNLTTPQPLKVQTKHFEGKIHINTKNIGCFKTTK